MLTLKLSQEACKGIKHAVVGIATIKEYARRKNQYMLTIQPQEYQMNYSRSWIMWHSLQAHFSLLWIGASAYAMVQDLKI